MINLLNIFSDEPAKHVLSHRGSKSNQAQAPQTMDEQTNNKEVMQNKLTKQKSLSLYKTLFNRIKSLEDDNRRLLDQQRCLHKILDNQEQMMEVPKNHEDATAIAK